MRVAAQRVDVDELHRAAMSFEVLVHPAPRRSPKNCSHPLLKLTREANYQVGKDTGRFWYAGASNVHWVIVKDGQVERDINEAPGKSKE